jgi:hypothetical protein
MRFLRIATGYLAATYCASLCAWLFLNDGPWTAIQIAALPMMALFGMLFAVPLTIVPFLFFATLAEIYQYRKLTYYVLTGVLTAMMVLQFLLWREGPVLTLFLFWAPAGALSGLLYWAIAGRKAGDTPRPGMGIVYCIAAGCGVASIITGTYALQFETASSTAQGSVLLTAPLFLLSSVSASYIFCTIAGRGRAT